MNWYSLFKEIGVITAQDLTDFQRYTRSRSWVDTIKAAWKTYENGWRFHAVEEDGRRVYFIWGVRKNV